MANPKMRKAVSGTRWCGTGLVAAALLGLVCGVVGCKGEEAVRELEALRDQACACEVTDEACVAQVRAAARAWSERYRAVRGGDADKARRLAEEIRACNPEALRGFLE